MIVSFRNKQTTTLLLLFFFLALELFIPTRAFADPRVDGCECTDYVYRQRIDIPLGMGHAKQWLTSARIHGFPYNQVPQVGDVAVIQNGAFGFSRQYGHVAIVSKVNGERNRFSIVGWDGLRDDCQLEVFHDLPVTASTFFIHHKSRSALRHTLLKLDMIPIDESLLGLFQ
jgi:hypothetical protein